MSDVLEFRGSVAKGVQLFAEELGVPGAADTSVPVRDWPNHLEPGTLNVRVEVFLTRS